MPVPSVISDLSQTAASNYPAGSDSPATLDDTQRAHASFIAQLRDGKGFTNPVSLASAATTDIGGQNALAVEITGTTTITSFGTTYNGPRFLRFTGALTLTHNAATLNLPGAANITTAAGDTCIAYPNQGATGWHVVNYQRANNAVIGTYGVRGLVGNVNGTTPLTKYDLSADSAVLRDANNFAVVRNSIATTTCDLGLAGPAANGRDQAAAFTASSWIHLYFIWNGTTVSTLASLTAPPTGPIMPSGYTHWAYAGALRWNSVSNIIPGRMQGDCFFYDLGGGGVNRVLTAGQATTMTAVACSGFVPPNVVQGLFNFIIFANHNVANTGFNISIRYTGSINSGVGYASAVSQVAGINVQSDNSVLHPLGTSQQIDYKIDNVPSTSGGAYIDVLGYTMPNGG